MKPLCHHPSLYSSSLPLFLSLLPSNLHVHSPTNLFRFSISNRPLCLSHMKTMVESKYRSPPFLSLSLSLPLVSLFFSLITLPLPFLCLTLRAGMGSSPVGTIASRAMPLGMYCALGCGRYLPLYVSRLL